MELSINSQKLDLSTDEAQALHRALGYYLKRIVSSCPNLPKTPIVKRLMLTTEEKWDKAKADILPSARSGNFQIRVGTFRGEVSRAEMLRVWKHLEKEAGDATGELLELADGDFMDDLFRTQNQD